MQRQSQINNNQVTFSITTDIKDFIDIKRNFERLRREINKISDERTKENNLFFLNKLEEDLKDFFDNLWTDIE